MERFPRLVVVLIAAAALVITMAGIRTIAGVFGPAFLALVLTIAVHPLRAFLTHRRIPGWLASTAMVLVVYTVLLALTFALVISVGRLAVLIPQYGPELEAYWRDVGDFLQARGVGDEQVQAAIDALDVGQAVSVATSLLGALLSLLSNLFFVFTLLLFLAFDTVPTSRVLAAVERERADLVAALRNFARGVQSYINVSAGFGFIVAIIDTAALMVLGVPGAFVWGVLSFVTNFIPNIGFILGVVPPAIIALLEGGPGLALAVIIIYSLVNVIIQTVIQPRIVGDSVGLSASLTFLSLVFWASLIGPLGALLAVPLTLLLKAVLVEADPNARWVLPIISGTPEPVPKAAPSEKQQHPVATQPE